MQNSIFEVHVEELEVIMHPTSQLERVLNNIHVQVELMNEYGVFQHLKNY